MPLSVWNGTAWTAAKAVHVSNGSAMVPAKKIKVWNGTGWALSWVPPVTALTIAFSKTGVETGEKFDVTVSYPAGFPEGTTVRVTTNTGYDTTFSPAEGATSVLVSQISHSAVGSPIWSAYATNKGGTSPTATKTQTVTAPASTDYTINGGTGAQLEDAMFAARTAGKTLRMTGTFNIWTVIYIPDGLTINATGAKINTSWDGTAYNAGRLRNAAKWPATSMPDTCTGYNGGSFVWTGGEFDGHGDGIFTISHSPGFTIQNTIMYRNCTSTSDGHAIECNSSGGNNDLGGSAYRVNILNNQFKGTESQRSNANDEPMHTDWAWQGSGCYGAEDHTMCANVRIAGNTFHRYSESWDGKQNDGFALCAIGGHRMSSASYGDAGNAGVNNPSNGEPSERHNWLLIENNAIHKAPGGTETSPNKGAVALWNWRDVIVRNNDFYACTASRLVSGWDATKNLNSADCNITITGNRHNSAGVTITMPADNTTGG